MTQRSMPSFLCNAKRVSLGASTGVKPRDSAYGNLLAGPKICTCESVAPAGSLIFASDGVREKVKIGSVMVRLECCNGRWLVCGYFDIGRGLPRCEVRQKMLESWSLANLSKNGALAQPVRATES